jgi:hypothetical protein
VKASHAFAPTFTHTAATYDFIITPKDTHSPVALNIPSGDYRMCLAPLTHDFLREIEARINSALFLATPSSSTTCTVTIDDAGVVTLNFSAVPDAVVINAVTARRLGFATSYATTDPIIGAYPAWYLALLTAGTGGWWQPVQSGGVEATAGGVVYSFAASSTSYTRSLDVQWQPTNPTYQVSCGCDATPMYPADAYLNSIGVTTTARQWSVLDVLFASRNALCGVAIGTWRTLKTSTSDTLFLAYVGAESLLGVKVEPFSPEWTPWQKWKLALVAPSAGMTTTRA